jgi:DNA-binding NarL/FixJ family response regulator
MSTLILADQEIITKNSILHLIDARPDFVSYVSITTAEDARRHILNHQPETIILLSTEHDRDLIDVIEKAAESKKQVRVIYLALYDEISNAVDTTKTNITAILAKRNSFEELLSTMMLIVCGGTFLIPRQEIARGEKQDLAKSHGLSRRELEVLRGIASGNTTKMIARSIGLSPKTIETYRSRLMQKLGVRGVAELVQFAVKNRLEQ